MELPGRGKKSIVTQVSIGGFDGQVKAKDLVTYLEDKIGLVDRCRLKTSSTPQESYPDFKIADTAKIERTDDYKKVEPHAFVHFTLPEYVTEACNAAGRCDLFWQNQHLKVSLGPENPYSLNQRRRTTTPHKLTDVLVEIGSLIDPENFYVAWRGPDKGVNFLVDPFDEMCRICFHKDVAFSFKGIEKKAVIKCDFQVGFLVRDINEIKRYKDPLSASEVILLQLASSPLIWYRTADDDIEESATHDLLDDDDPWIRTTDFTPSGAIGRCNFYRISMSVRYGNKLMKAMKYLKDQRVQEILPSQPIKIKNEPSYGVLMSDHFFSIHSQEGIAFDILFLVNAIMHKGILNQHRLSDSFFEWLRNRPKDVNVAALKHICSYKRPVFDAAKRLKVVQEWLLRNPKLYQISKQSDDIVEVRRLVITPTKAYCLPPDVEMSNRVLRNFKEVADRFLRVTFMDEGMQTINASALNYYVAPIVKEITSNPFPQKTNIYRRVKTILEKGFHFCGRKYSFLAFSSNQLRDHSAWFFAEETITCDHIRDWMGRFNQRNVAKCAARMGQCFSSTYATVEVAARDYKLIPDIKRNNYDFSDGIGIIRPDLARAVAEKLKLDDVPSAYQIRYAGFKGVVACWPASDDAFQLSLRSSMNKFESTHTTLEICSWTRFQPGFLNRQIVTLLSALNVPDDVFWNMQEAMVSKLNKMLVDVDVAFDVLTKSCAEHGNAAAIMLSVGFSPELEPHLRGILTSVRAAQLWGLREKARIFVSSGRWLMGVLDELGVLEQGQCFVQVSAPSLENCFAKHGSRFKETKNLQVVKGFVVIAKNPCLHPGDVRILEAVDAPGLHHLHDCLVFPQKGDRPHTNEASGSDLDGDLYFVTWDENLIPPSKRSWTPMEYISQESKLLSRQVTTRDITEFFVRNMVTENLGAICNAHVVHADLSDYGALDENCIALAELAATAVDFPKTGKVVSMPSHLKPKLYPDFMGKQPHQSYKSKKILGRLYRRIKDAYDEDLDGTSSKHETGDIPYDANLEVPGAVEFIYDAWAQKCCYDGQLNGLLSQYKVEREEEVVTGQIWSMPKYSSRKQGELKERLKHAYSALKKEFRQTFEKLDSNMEELNDEEKHLLYEQKASAWYLVTYHPEWVKKSRDLQDKSVDHGNNVMLSFPWIAVDYLACIKIRNRGVVSVDSTKPVDSLAKYLAERL
ncbi:RNA-dependent RNA polymerase 6 [Prosopis cineraria]|uniref:RNA-dependent RNA polymerase 6 n=1 Tax=Prosopis cineraria TaxID=364024 RepID=UPI00241054E9|nr:RNA-dependent RNA polymerase 6 [Prosopis cineraria]